MQGLLVAVVVLVPIVAAGFSPLLAWRDPIYILAGFAGIAAMGMLFVQPLLMCGALLATTTQKGARLHRFLGGALVLLVLAHLVGLWITSPPDVIDALLYRSPTPFSFWGVSAMWLLLLAAAFVGLRRRLRLRPRISKRLHRGFVSFAVLASVIHAVTITGTMETYSKIMLCGMTLCAMVYGVWFKFR